MRYWNWGLLLWLTVAAAFAGWVGAHAAVFVLWQLMKHGPAMVGVTT